MPSIAPNHNETDLQFDFSHRILEEHRNTTNRMFSRILRYAALFTVVIMVLNLCGVFKIDWVIYPVLGGSMLVMLLPTLFYDFLHYDSPFLHYLFLTVLSLMSGVLYAFLSYHVIIMIVFPVVVSCLYYEKRSVIFVAAVQVPIIVASHLIAFVLKVVPDEPLVTLKGVLLYGVLPRLVEYIIFVVIGIVLTSRFQKLIQSFIHKNEELYQSQRNTVESLSMLVESRSQYTGKHIKRVSEYTRVLCEGLSLPRETVWLVSTASMMHDIGKLIVPRELLNKPGPLTESEFAKVQKHTEYGETLLKNAQGELLEAAKLIAKEHHEWYDGNGYYGKKGEEIHLYARIVAIADVFDSLVSERPYKKAWTLEEARDEVLAQSGKHFDPKLVELFDAHFDELASIFASYQDEPSPMIQKEK